MRVTTDFRLESARGASGIQNTIIIRCQFVPEAPSEGDPQMNRWRWTVGLLAVVAVALAVWGAAAFRRTRPTINVLLITLDTTRADRIGCYGDPRALTPIIDGLAAQGVLFERANSPAPLTLPTHASLFTGLYPAEHGLRTNGRSRLSESIPTLATILKGSGYETAAFVSSFVLDAKFGLDRGFDHYGDDFPGDPAAAGALQRQRDGHLTVDEAVEWLAAPRQKPVFCWVHLYDPHFPYLDHADEFGDRFQDRPYDAEIAYVDRQVGRLLDQLQLLEEGSSPDSLVIIVGDHGEGLGDHVERTHGYTLYESTQRVPWIIRMPQAAASKGGANEARGRRVPEVVSLVDLTPTVVDLLGLDLPEAVSGRSLRGAMEGRLVPEVASHAATDDPFLQNGWSPLRSLTTSRWKYIRTTRPELFDLQADPHELQNLIEQEPRQAEEMARRLDDTERRMKPRRSASVQLSAAERRALETLGYLRGQDQPEAAIVGAPGGAATQLPDVKDMIPFDVATEAARDLLRSGKVTEGADALREVIASAPAHVAAKVFLGEALESLGQFDEAMSWYQAALKQRPTDLDALVHLGAAYAAKEHLPEAIAQFDEAVRIDPESSTARYNLGKALVRTGQTDDGIAQFEEALRIDPAMPNAHTSLGNALIALGRADEAEAHFRQEIELDAKNIDARLSLATILAERRPEESERLLRDALKLQPDDPRTLYNLGAFLLLTHRPAEAIKPLEQVVRLQPRHPQAASALDRARRLAAEKSTP